MTRDRRRIQSDWANKPANPKMDRRVIEAISRRRRQMLIHCYLYYGMDSPIIDDHTWAKWSFQLRGLQNKYGWRIGFYDKVFRGWDGSSGHHLHYDADVIRVAKRVHDEFREKEYILG